MKNESNSVLSNIDWKQVARITAIASGIFSLITAMFLLVNFVQERAGVPEKERFYSEQYTEYQAQLRSDPQNEELKQNIRDLDLAMRQDYFFSKRFIEQGKYFLLVGVVLFLISIKYLLSLHPVPRHKKNKDKNPEQEAINKQQTRQVVYSFGVVLAACVLGMTAIPTIEIPVAIPAVEIIESYPTAEELAQNWHRFRGAGGLGISTHENIPTYWNEETGEGVNWKVEVPLPGHNSPIIWGDRVFISGADEDTKVIFCYSATNGEMLWQHSLDDVPVMAPDGVDVFMDTGYAAATMACDGYRVYAIFADGVIGACTLDGNRVWAKHLGVPDNMYGLASSLTTYENLVLIQNDQGYEDDELSKVIALDGKTGNTAWEVSRPVAGSWTSPIIIHTEQNDQFITCSEPWVISYLPKTGEELWRAHLLGMDVAPSPVFENNLVFAIQPGSTVFAVDPSGNGDVTESKLKWELDFPAPDITSPVANDGLLYLLAGGYISCHDLTNNGEVLWEEDMGDTFSASPTIVNDLIYIISNEGTSYFVKTGRTFERLDVTCKINDKVNASPAFKESQMFIRSQSFLYGIGTTENKV